MDAKHIDLYVEDRPAEGAFRIHSSVCTDPELFEIEMEFIYARTRSLHPDWSVAGRFEMRSEAGFHACHREWARLMEAGLSGRKAYL